MALRHFALLAALATTAVADNVPDNQRRQVIVVCVTSTAIRSLLKTHKFANACLLQLSPIRQVYIPM